MSMDCWDELFASAAGESNSVTADAQEDANEKGKKRKKRKRQNSARTNSTIGLKRQVDIEVLKSRISRIPAQLPSWLCFGPSLLSTGLCDGWKDGGDCRNGSKERGMRGRSCESCQMSSTRHSLVVDFKKAGVSKTCVQHDLFALFALVRDIRCCCSSAAEDMEHLINQRKRPSKGNYSEAALYKARGSLSLCRMLQQRIPTGEGDILEEKCQILQRQVNDWCQAGKGVAI